MTDVDETHAIPAPTPQATAPVAGTPDSLAAQLIAALGLPEHTYMLEILFMVEAPVRVRCHYYPTREAMQQAVIMLAEYELVARTTEPPAAPEPFQPAEEGT